jgi:hypothetical protein
MTTRLIARMPFGEVVEVLEEVGGIGISKSSVWHMGQAWGARFEEEMAAEEEEQKATARAWSTPGGRKAPQQRMGVAVDGALMYVLEEGWKEFKLGCVYQVRQQTQQDARTGDVGQFGQAEQTSYVAHLGGPQAFGWQIWAEAQRRGWSQACDTQMVGDGAPWIWNLQQEHFHESISVVDWYHATEHLGHAKLLLHPQEGPGASRWYREHEQALFLGHARRVAGSLNAAADQSDDPEQAEALRKSAAYFNHNRDRMHYHDLRNEGWPIGSGMVESGAKQFKARFTGPGMRWSRQGAKHILPLRAALMTSKHRFDDLWSRAVANSPLS